MIALAQHLKDDSTAPTATASVGSLVKWECLLSSSNSCLWKVAASASRAIWGPWRKEGRYWGWRVTQSRSLSHTHTHHRHGAVSLIPLCPCSVSLIYAENRYSVSSVTCQDQVTCLPSRACENNDGRGQALKGGLHSANSNGLCVVFAVWRGTTQVLKHLPMEHGRLSFTCDLAHVRDWRCKERRCFHTNNKHVLWWRRVGWKN